MFGGGVARAQPRLLRPLVLAVDVGTSSVRALVYDSELRPVPGAEAHRPHHPKLTPDGGALLDPRTLLRHVAGVVDAALAAIPEEPIAAVGVSSFWHGLVAADSALRPLTPILLWSDSRSWAEAERLRARLEERAVHGRTGCRIHPSYWPSKIAWLRRRDRRLRRPGVLWLSPLDLVYARLFDDPRTSSSLASGTGLRQLRRERWDAELLDALGITAEQLPAVEDRPRVGLAGAWRRRWPRLAGVPWAAPAGDGGLANLGSGCLDERRRALTIGTSGALRVLTRKAPQRLPPSLWCYRAGAERFVVGGALSNGGNLHAWLTSLLHHPVLPARTQPGAHGLTFLPLLAGERSPGYALRASGALAGLTQATTAADLLQAGLEAVAATFGRLDRDLDRVVPGAELLVGSGGGLLADPAWMRMLADATGRRLAASRAREASARGAAILALQAAGLADFGRDLARLDPGTERPLRPSRDPEVHRAYDLIRRRQEALYEVLVTGRLLETAASSAPAHLRRPKGPR